MRSRTDIALPSDPEWGMAVRNMLRAGLGVEDIRVSLRKRGLGPYTLDHIRLFVRSMRENGTLLDLYRRDHDDRKT